MDRGLEEESGAVFPHAPNLDNPRPRADGSTGVTFSTAGPVTNHEPVDRTLEVLIVGNLTLEFRRRTRGKKSDLTAALNGAGPGKKPSWPTTLGRPQAGGFVAGAARVAHSLWCRVHLACIVPVPLPHEFEGFFQEINANTDHVIPEAGEPSWSVRLDCDDGQLRLQQPGVKVVTALRVPAGALERFDAILVEPMAQPQRSAVWEALRPGDDATSRRATVALRAGSDWDGPDLEAARGCGHWLFLDRQRVMEAGRRITGNAEIALPSHCPCPLKNVLGSCRQVAALGACLKERIGPCRLVTGLGACGTLMLSRTPQPEYFPTAPISSPEPVEAGDVLLAVTALSSASGASDQQSVRRGVVAATGSVAGLPLPLSLEELDI